MRFATIATVLVASASAAFALPAEADTATTNTTTVLKSRATVELRVFANTRYDFQGTHRIYKSAGNYKFNFDAQSWDYYDAGCCVSFCKNGKRTGYRCNANSSNQNVAAANRFNQVIIKCGGIPAGC